MKKNKQTKALSISLSSGQLLWTYFIQLNEQWTLLVCLTLLVEQMLVFLCMFQPVKHKYMFAFEIGS